VVASVIRPSISFRALAYIDGIGVSCSWSGHS
jgi:hypothetical protein